ncbi:desumoylating isopeptidase 1 homolog isoform X2 [Dysidea avara]|uniref:desumoylating isopeptidase 1 homolog isoform X2 n=1 Tax=Dysidea avara TaxID=196820 RepID=UPI003321A409
MAVNNNQQLARFGVGIHHTGIEVYGIEYAYGGHAFDDTGVYEMSPRNEEEVCGEVIFNVSLFVGKTDLSESQARTRIYQIAEQFSGNTYHLLTRNCNHFTQEVCQELTGEILPSWVNRLAKVSSYIPFVNSFLPASWLYPWRDEKDEQSQTSSPVSFSASYKRMPIPSEKSYIV